MYNAEIYSNKTNLNYFMSSLNLCDQDYVHSSTFNVSKLLFLNESNRFISAKSKLTVYVAEKWFRIENEDRNEKVYYNNDYLFTFRAQNLSDTCLKSEINTHPFNRISPYLYIGLNRVIADARLLPGTGLCKANISFLNCFMNEKPDMNIDVNNLEYTASDTKHIDWIYPLAYMEPTSEHQACSAQGVVRLRFDPFGERKIARFDLELGKTLSGFSFNLGDSPTNNAYGNYLKLSSFFQFVTIFHRLCVVLNRW
jgi:hypothetical protein